MRFITVTLAVLLIATLVMSAPVDFKSFKSSSKLTVTKRSTEQLVREALWQKARKARPELDLCPTCVQLVGQTINQLLNIILSGGVIGTCGALCSAVAQEFPANMQSIISTGCSLLCDYVGVTEFIKLVEKADLDPIWLCEEAKICPVHDCTAAVCGTFKDLRVVPAKAPMGSTFQLVGILQIYNQTSTGEQVVEIVPPESEPLGDGELVPGGWAPGTYDLAWSVQISNDQQQQQDDPFTPGLYQVAMAACEGQCGSKHSHTRTIATVFGNFTVTAH